MIFVYITMAICVTLITCAYLGREDCRHIWKIHDTREITYSNPSRRDNIQTVQIWSCTSCGKLVRINLTSGDTAVVCQGGPAFRETNKV